jgi:hypothetical protein
MYFGEVVTTYKFTEVEEKCKMVIYIFYIFYFNITFFN